MFVFIFTKLIIMKGNKVYVLLSKENDIIDIWSNLKHLCGDMGERTEGLFTSYWTLARNPKEENAIWEFTSKNGVSYKIQIKVVK